MKNTDINCLVHHPNGVCNCHLSQYNLDCLSQDKLKVDSKPVMYKPKTGSAKFYEDCQYSLEEILMRFEPVQDDSEKTRSDGECLDSECSCHCPSREKPKKKIEKLSLEETGDLHEFIGFKVITAILKKQEELIDYLNSERT